MTDVLKSYPAYKDSGVEWLGEVPEHWEVRRLKRIVQLNPSKSEVPLPLRDGRAVFLPMERVGSDGRFDASEIRPISDLWNGFTYFRQGDIIVAKITPCFENGKGAYLDNLPAALGFGSTEFHVLRPSKAIAPAYLYRVTTLSEFRRLGADEMTGAAGQQRVPVEFIANFLIPIPPLPEQTAIVRFLDHADRRIRRYIRAKQKLIKLLEEYKQAVIHQAVTGQIDVRLPAPRPQARQAGTGKPYPAYKPSGVEWLGEVPEHWEVAALRLRYHQCLGKMLDSKRITGVHLLPYLRNVDVQWDRIDITDLPMMDIHPDEYERYTVRPGDLLVCEGGEVGRCAIWKGELETCGFQKALHRLRPRRCDCDEPRFLFFALRLAATLGAFNDGQESTIGHLTGEKIRAHRFAFPSKEEQTAIARLLDEQTEKIDAAIAAARHEVELLREYRERLIADVVTGKVDVRDLPAATPACADEPHADRDAAQAGAAARLPEEPEEPERLAEPDEEADGEGRDESEPDQITAEDLEGLADE